MRVIEGDCQTAGYLLFGAPTSAIVDYVSKSVGDFTNVLSTGAKNLYTKTVDLFSSLNNLDTVRIAENVIRKSSTLDYLNIIKPLTTLEEIQTTSPFLQRWVMSTPELKNLYDKQRCQGYTEETYINYFPNVCGMEHYDYRLVVDELFIEKDGVETIVHYNEDFTETTPLTLIDKSIILDIHEVTRYYMELGFDPSDPMGGEL